MLTSIDCNSTMKEVTIIYYGEQSLELRHSVELLPQMNSGRIVIPESFKEGKSIIAVCKGSVEILNKFGDRIEFNQDNYQVM